MEALFKATTELLIAAGFGELTTTRIANRAGFAVAAIYRWFPNKHALVQALCQRHLDGIARKLEEQCRKSSGSSLAGMAEGVVQTYWFAEFDQLDVTRALYRSMVDVDGASLIGQFSRRVETAAIAMLLTAPGATFDNVSLTSLTMLTAVFGTVRGVLERDLPMSLMQDVRDETIRMCATFLEGVGSPAGDRP